MAIKRGRTDIYGLNELRETKQFAISSRLSVFMMVLKYSPMHQGSSFKKIFFCTLQRNFEPWPIYSNSIPKPKLLGADFSSHSHLRQTNRQTVKQGSAAKEMINLVLYKIIS